MTPNDPFPRDHELRWMRFASLALAVLGTVVILVDIADRALGATGTIGGWLFAIGLVGAVYSSWTLGWRESKRKEAASR